MNTPKGHNNEEEKRAVFSQESEAWMAHMSLIERALSEYMGGALPAALDLSHVRQALDVGCGVGGWIYEMAWRHPTIQFVGIDRNVAFIECARKRILGGVANATYLVQDMFHLDEFTYAPASFDLVHLRFLAGEVRPQQFPLLLRALRRLCRPGALLVWTEAEFPLTNSLALQCVCDWVQRALRAGGRAFSPGSAFAATAFMRSWLASVGCHILHDHAYALDVSAPLGPLADDPTLHEIFCRQAGGFAQQVRSFILDAQVAVPEVFDEICSLIQNELHAESFRGVCYLRTVIGRVGAAYPERAAAAAQREAEEADHTTEPLPDLVAAGAA